MKISFFEEFPTEENLSRLDLVTFSTHLYIAARSLKEFNRLKGKIRDPNVVEVIYWPVLSKKEGYWISPFSDSKALKRIFEELKGHGDVPVMIDAELPTTQNYKLFFTQAPKFFKNKQLIHDFILHHPNVCVAEYYPGRLRDKVLSVLGIHFNPKDFKHRVIRMMYHSMRPFERDIAREKLAQGYKEFGDRFLVGYGTIAKGVKGDEPKLSLKALKKDLELAKEVGVKEVVLFRLGGLDKEYVDLLKKYKK